MKAYNKNIYCLLSAILLFFILNCSTGSESADKQAVFPSYRDIPGVTQEEIDAIEMLRAKYNSFIYAMTPGTEAFHDANGEPKGYITHFSKWLTDLFEIDFTPIIVDSWEDFLDGLESGELAFAGDLTATDERRQTYFMTDAIAHRSLKYYRIAGNPALSEIRKTRLPRYLLLEGSINTEEVLKYAIEKFEPVFVKDFNEAYGVLKSGKADVCIAENTAESFYDEYGDVIVEDFLPLIYSPVSFSTRVPEFAPIVSVVQKALENGADIYLNELYNTGIKEYKKHKLFLNLTEEEKAYINSNPVIMFGAEFDNYPSSFYNERAKQWQGICFDLLDEVTAFTGLEFQVPHNEKTGFHELIKMLENGEVSLVSEVIATDEKQGRILWSEKFYMEDRTVLISRVTQPNIDLYMLYSMKVGITRDTAYVEYMNNWFPNHPGIVIYNNQEDAFEALKKGEVDMTMNSYKSILYITNYLEHVDFKANIIFDDNYKSTFGFNLNEEHLCSIFDKVFELIDVNLITEQWLHRSFDYKLRIAQARMPLAYGIASLLLLLFGIVVVALIINNKKSKTIDTAEKANKAKTAFLANMSHEIRTPMNAILGVTEILLHNESLPDEIAEGLDKIYNSCELLLGIINDILDFSKIEAGKIDIMPAKYKVADLINDSVQLNVMRIESKPIDFVLEIDDNIPAKLIGDELRIKQILTNLLSNAFKYTDSGRVTLSVSVKDAMLVLKVRDTGHGMSQEQIDKLFDEYVRFVNATDRSIEGTGLGLAIARRLITLMGGDICVESEPDKGSLFTVKLPQEMVDDEVLGSEVAENLRNFNSHFIKRRKRAQIVRDPMPYGSVLIVDDVETNVYVAAGLMKLYKLKVDTVMSGKEAIEKIKSSKEYDIIFMDHMMPEMDGIEATKRLREMGYKFPVIALTANAVSGQADMFLKSGFDDFISKPIDIRQLNAVLNKLIRDKQSPEIIQAARMQYSITEVNENTPIRINKKLIESFVHDAHKTIELLDDLLKNDTLKNEEGLRKFTINIHGIKSALGNIGETVLSQSAYKLEQAGNEHNINYITSSISDFIKELRALLEKIDKSKNKLIFAVDDNDTNLTMAALALKDDYKVLTIPSATKMFSVLEKKQPDLILLDIEMPDMTGFEAYAKMKENPDWKDIPVVFLTGHEDEDVLTKAKGMGAVNVIQKPIVPNALLECVKKHCPT